MKKIQSLFQRNYDGDRLVRDEVVPGSEWVIQGMGVPTRKLDGTCCCVTAGKLLKRYEVKKGRTPPSHFFPASEVDPITGKQQGWVPVGEGPEDQWHREAWESAHASSQDGTYELVGPKIQGGAEIEFTAHTLIRHGSIIVSETPRTFDAIKNFLTHNDLFEGIVWHHPDGRMVKIKRRDFGLPWPRVTTCVG